MNETRRTIRVFFASSHEMSEEREGFAAAIQRVGELPGVRRNYILKPVRWESEGFGGAFDDINETIRSSTQFDTLDIVVIGLWNRIRPGTEGEYERARSLYRIRRRPRLLVFTRSPQEGVEPHELDKLRIFKQKMIDDGVIPNEYQLPEVFFRRLEEQIVKLLDDYPRLEPAPILVLRKRFMTAAVCTFGLSVAAIALCQTMAYYFGMNRLNLFFVLASPVTLSLGALFSHWYYHRLLGALKGIWHSPSFTDEDLYEGFRDLVPSFAVPPALDRRFHQPAASVALTLLFLAVAFFSPVIAQYQCLLDISGWHVAVGHDVVTDDKGKPVVEKRGKGLLVRNLYVDERKEGSWPFSLQDPAARAKYEAGHEILYVYAPGAFDSGENLPAEELYRRNLGLQVWLPWQLWIYLVLLIATALAGIFLFIRLARFRNELQTIAEPVKAR
ncbi:MAG TPA: hypothetical protein VH988_19885 [Thermoanaerobaculia bacterium]|jgi:hypothetical protein|nr:hypothetical protein [Thermoanaerobaculia bacterium]